MLPGGEVVMVPYIRDTRPGSAASGKLVHMNVEDFKTAGGEVLLRMFEEYFTAPLTLSEFHHELTSSKRRKLTFSTLQMNLHRDEITTEFRVTSPMGIEYYRVASTPTPETIVAAVIAAVAIDVSKRDSQ